MAPNILAELCKTANKSNNEAGSTGTSLIPLYALNDA
jgi:hypothetical protein